MTAILGGADAVLDDAAVSRFVEEQLGSLDLDGRSLCLVIPDATRACPLPLLLGAIHRTVAGRVRSCTAVVALGTHTPMGDAELRALVGVDGLPVVNHQWWSDDAFSTVGHLDAEDVARLSGGRLAEKVEVRVNRLVVESDVTVIVGPVLPHEVVGFSGGNKYLFPGLSGTGAHRPHPLGRRADHQSRDHRNPGHHPRAGARRGGRGHGDGGAVQPLRGG